ncbi:hypothetical protein N7454_010106 [Penicillium verhagenii]|nr:hypothetical protein N7454_010106 [Penicillium verhagenii]
MRLPWSILGLVAISSAIPTPSSHEIHLNYLPDHSISPESYLSVEWSMQDGTLYANGDRIFPPSVSSKMQVHAPRYEGVQKKRLDTETLYYSLEVRPLSSHEVGAPHGIVRVNVDFLGEDGKPVTPNTVVLDLLDHPDGNPRITKIRIEPGKSRSDDRDERKWQMKFWQTEMGALFQHKDHKDHKGHKDAGPSQSDSTMDPASQSSKLEVSESKPSGIMESTVGYIFSPYFAPSSYSHRSHRRPHDHDHDHTFMRLVRPVILPAFLGAAAGLFACLVGFLVGHVIMSVSYRLGLRKNPRHRYRRSRVTHVEDDMSEKAGLLPETNVTESEV